MATRTPPADLAGVLLGGRYRVVRGLERGGMGSVYEARDERIGRAVAVKLMLPELASDAVLLERFRREALATAALAHTNIVQVTDYGEGPDGHAFLAMELLVGRSLASILSESGALPVARSVAIVRQTCAALEAAHAAGIVHRDLKPGNLLIVPTGDGRELVKVVDFGVAQLKRSAAYGRLTATGAILGTPAFMPPEQARGEEVDARADVYAVGAILYGCLAGRKPFDGDPGAVIRQLLTETPPRLSSLRPEVGLALEGVVATAMAKDRGSRFASARALADALAGALGVEDGDAARHVPLAPAHPESVAGSIDLGTRLAEPERSSRSPRRSWMVVGLLGLALAAVAVVATVVVLELASARAQSSAPPATATTMPTGVAVTPSVVVAPPTPVVLPPKPPLAGDPVAQDPAPMPAPPTHHHHAPVAASGASQNGGWESTGWVANPDRPR